MKNCLITKLKGVVDGFLPCIDDLSVEITDSERFKLIAKTTAFNVVARADSPILYALDYNGEKTGSPLSSLTIGEYGIGVASGSNGNVIYVNNKDTMREIYLQGCATNLRYSNELDVITMIGSLCSKYVPQEPVTHGVDKIINIHGFTSGVDVVNIGELAPITNMAALWKLDYGWDPSYSCTLDITEEWCKNHSAISDINSGNQFSQGDFNALGFTRIGWIVCGPVNDDENFGFLRGTVEQFVANARVSGRPTGACTFQYLNTKYITFNGSQHTIGHDELTNLTWTEDTITWNGVTINA